MSPQKPIKRKRRGKKGDNCGQCGGTDSSNKEGVPEQMVHCDECGLAGMSYYFDQVSFFSLFVFFMLTSLVEIVRNTAFFSLLFPVHPSCHDLARISENLFSYAWKCVECKNCEVCQEKGAEVGCLIFF